MADTSVTPDAVDAFIELMVEALPDVLVVDGPDPVGDDAEALLYVGLADPRSTSRDNSAGSFDQTWSNATAQTRTEDGSFLCSAVRWDGSGDMRTARRGAFSIVATAQWLLMSNVRLASGGSDGVDGLIKTSFTNVAWDQRQTTRGALCVVLFAIKFESRLQRSSS